MPTQDVVHVATEQFRDVGTDLAYLEVGFAHDGQDAARLHAAGDVDRFPRAIVEIDGRADRHEGIRRSAVRISDRQRAGSQMVESDRPAAGPPKYALPASRGRKVWWSSPPVRQI
ncbi:hypothetical protein MGAD_39880 [Mycolicibacterium gadium]|uniref:Uncharacterized protein n=1 Tax=Mycolicibacterium gadium TaxID=1794 RepID=A0A7I7WT94_MYCGU|nr:hypothetical protein MGAD_39880 [Mycolicibacterium gadium]